TRAQRRFGPARSEVSGTRRPRGLKQQSPARLARADAADHAGLKSELLGRGFDDRAKAIGRGELRLHAGIVGGERGREDKWSWASSGQGASFVSSVSSTLDLCACSRVLRAWRPESFRASSLRG